MNDMTYLLFYLSFFVLLGVFIPLINAEFKQETNINPTDDLLNTDEKNSSLTIWKIIGNLFLIPFWTLGVPNFLNLTLLLIFRVHLIVLISRFIWIGGGS